MLKVFKLLHNSICGGKVFHNLGPGKIEFSDRGSYFETADQVCGLKARVFPTVHWMEYLSSVSNAS